MNLPSNCSMLIEDWVMVIVPPGGSIAVSPPGDSARYLPPSRPSLVTSALESFGSLIWSFSAIVTSAR